MPMWVQPLVTLVHAAARTRVRSRLCQEDRLGEERSANGSGTDSEAASAREVDQLRAFHLFREAALRYNSALGHTQVGCAHQGCIVCSVRECTFTCARVRTRARGEASECRTRVPRPQVGLCYELGTGVARNPRRAVEHFRRAAARNEPRCAPD